MKSIYSLAFLLFLIPGCKKYQQDAPGTKNTVVRNVRFELFTNEHFETDHKNIQFRVIIRNEQHTLLDSSLATMQVNEIPDSLHRIIVEKQVPGNDPATLTVGFDYTIENVGTSWYLEQFLAGDTLKVLRYPFR
jgi:hypothetical protein